MSKRLRMSECFFILLAMTLPICESKSGVKCLAVSQLHSRRKIFNEVNKKEVIIVYISIKSSISTVSEVARKMNHHMEYRHHTFPINCFYFINKAPHFLCSEPIQFAVQVLLFQTLKLLVVCARTAS